GILVTITNTTTTQKPRGIVQIYRVASNQKPLQFTERLTGQMQMCFLANHTALCQTLFLALK
ncbi:MAG: hypothetical protein P8104_12115, partial [Gammaproteobacteria bacterium]